MADKLTPKRERFCQEYLIDLNATQAYIRAGYSEKGARINACRLLTNNNIQERIAELQLERSERVKIDQDWVIKKWCALVKQCMDDKVQDSAGANKALENLAKHLGMFEGKGERKPDELNLNQIIVDGLDFSGKPNDELVNRLKRLVGC